MIKTQGAGPPTAQRRWVEATFSCEVPSVGAARLLVTQLRLCPEIEGRALLIVSELATNAVVYTSGGFSLRLQPEPRFRVEVVDHSSVMPELFVDTAWADHGRGLRIVQALASRWGAEPCGDGKVVWAEVALPL
ncbi:MAG: ATP-binding protein [Acidimicrobiales bacterium]